MNLLTDFMRKKYDDDMRYRIKDVPQKMPRLSSLPPIPAFNPQQPENKWMVESQKKRELKNIQKGFAEIQKLGAEEKLGYSKMAEIFINQGIPVGVADRLAARIVTEQTNQQSQKKIEQGKQNTQNAYTEILATRTPEGPFLDETVLQQILRKHDVPSPEAKWIMGAISTERKRKEAKTSLSGRKETMWKNLIEGSIDPTTLSPIKRAWLGITTKDSKVPTVKKMGDIWWQWNPTTNKWDDTGKKEKPTEEKKTKGGMTKVTDYIKEHGYNEKGERVSFDENEINTIKEMIKDYNLDYEFVEERLPAQRRGMDLWLFNLPDWTDIGEPNLPEETSYSATLKKKIGIPEGEKSIKLTEEAISAGWTPEKIQEAATKKGKTIEEVLKDLGIR